MANFNEAINLGTGYILDSQDFFIYRAEAMDDFEQNIDDDLYCRTNAYRLFIQYKTTHRVKKVAGRCFLWDNSNGDHMKDPGNGIELRSINDASQDDCEGFGNPRFDGMESAIFITDRDVFVYGDVQIEANYISKDKNVICYVSLCGSMVSSFRIQAEVFDSLFGLKENFPKQYEKLAKMETLQSEKIYAAYELACLMDSNRLCSDFLSSLLRLNSVIYARHCNDDIYDKSQAARKAVEDLAIELGISISKIEDELQ